MMNKFKTRRNVIVQVTNAYWINFQIMHFAKQKCLIFHVKNSWCNQQYKIMI